MAAGTASYTLEELRRLVAMAREQGRRQGLAQAKAVVDRVGRAYGAFPELTAGPQDVCEGLANLLAAEAQRTAE